ncbi:glycosyltransferase [Marinobacterium sp. xm-d-530]|uniref:glycosyltransferase n=1 Tax=Marinobacterium sp. xm-d-530 TaxID=2497747 RepID=UPI001569C621|nr:glycosyltransferase [Marinobacterium sp. xm-d-530]
MLHRFSKKHKRQSLLFVRPDYHCSFIYRDELRKRGWKADVFVDPLYPRKLLYRDDVITAPHSYSIQKYRYLRYMNNIVAILWWLLKATRYKYHVYYGRPPVNSYFETKFGLTRIFGRDFSVELAIARFFGIRLIYVPPGCHDEALKEEVMKFDNGQVCGNCGAYDRCDDNKNKLNFSRLRRYFDARVGFGTLDPTVYVASHMKYKVIDLDLWCPDMEVPPEHVLPETNALRIMHSSNLAASGRTWKQRDIKGSPFVFEAVDRLKAEGYNVDYYFVDNVRSRDMRYYQAQADIVVDQLRYGWWGSTLIECAALGKPVICYLRESWKSRFLSIFKEYSSLPVIEADVDTIYDELKKLVDNESYRLKNGHEMRKFAEQHFNPESNVKAFIKLLESI